MPNDQIKTSFQKVKQDILNLQSQIQTLTRELQELKRTLYPTKSQETQTDRQTTSTHQHPLEALKPQNPEISTGNEGVPTDRQTNQQTDRHIQKFAQASEQTQETDKITKLEQVSQALESLDEIKRDLRNQFKKLTPQEMLIFTTIYQLEEQGNKPDYQQIADKLKLSESSIRDYVIRLVNKDIPIDKTKLDNKKVQLSISQNLKRIASLQTIIQLREL